MSGHGQRGRGSAVVLAGVTAGCSLLVTVAVAVLPFVRFAYRAPAVHVVIETANATIALLVAFLLYGRFRETRQSQALLLSLALCAGAIANLVLTALPSALAIGRGEDPTGWAALAIRFIGTVLLAAAALTRYSRETGARTASVLALALAAGVCTIGVLGTVYGSDLPPAVDPSQPLGNASFPDFAANPIVLTVQGLASVLWALAAVAFTRQAGRTGDELMRWVGAGCVLGSAARIHYLLYPSLYTDYVYTGDLLRFGSYLFMLIGAAREIRSFWGLRAHTAVLEERRRMARDLHDGLAQELSYISAQSRRLTTQAGDAAIADRIEAAAGRALDEARRAIAALSRPVSESFAQALQHVVDDMAHRYDVKVVTDLAQVPEVHADQAEALLRVVGEAVRNAVRHGKADRIEVQLTAQPLSLAVVDNGRGFDVGTAAGRSGGFGITSMRERATALGAELEILSTAGEGTTVRVTRP